MPHLPGEIVRAIFISKGFLQSEGLGEVSVLEGGSGLVLLGHSEQKKPQQKLQPQIPMALHSKTGEISGKKLHDEVLQGDPRQHFQSSLVNFIQFFPRFLSILVSFSQSQSILVSSTRSHKTKTQELFTDRNRAKQHPSITVRFLRLFRRAPKK